MGMVHQLARYDTRAHDYLVIHRSVDRSLERAPTLPSRSTYYRGICTSERDDTTRSPADRPALNSVRDTADHPYLGAAKINLRPPYLL